MVGTSNNKEVIGSVAAKEILEPIRDKLIEEAIRNWQEHKEKT